MHPDASLIRPRQRIHGPKNEAASHDQKTKYAELDIDTQTLKYDSSTMVYTDGCHKKETNLAGAGIYGLLNGQEICIRVRPSKSCPVPTSTELS